MRILELTIRLMPHLNFHSLLGAGCLPAPMLLLEDEKMRVVFVDKSIHDIPSDEAIKMIKARQAKAYTQIPVHDREIVPKKVERKKVENKKAAPQKNKGFPR